MNLLFGPLQDAEKELRPFNGIFTIMGNLIRTQRIPCDMQTVLGRISAVGGKR